MNALGRSIATVVVTSLVTMRAIANEVSVPLDPSNTQDIWTTSVYSYAPGGGGPGGGRNDDYLVIGGWGDRYYALIQFVLDGLPSEATSVFLNLYNAENRGSSTTQMYLDRVTSDWDWTTGGTGSDNDRLWWADRPSYQYTGTVLPAATVGEWYSIDITGLYNGWQSGDYDNFGLQLRPVSFWNTWNEFYSSDYSGNANLLPYLMIEYTPGTGPGPNFIFPLFGEQISTLNTEAFSGEAYDGIDDSAHYGVAALDLDAENSDGAFVLAAGNGVIHEISYGGEHWHAPGALDTFGNPEYTKCKGYGADEDENGNPDPNAVCVIIDHGNDYFTEYRHLTASGAADFLASLNLPDGGGAIPVGSLNINAGDVLSSYADDQTHLHFQVIFDNNSNGLPETLDRELLGSSLVVSTALELADLLGQTHVAGVLIGDYQLDGFGKTPIPLVLSFGEVSSQFSSASGFLSLGSDLFIGDFFADTLGQVSVTGGGELNVAGDVIVASALTPLPGPVPSGEGAPSVEATALPDGISGDLSLDNGTVSAGNIFVGAGGRLRGDGTINAGVLSESIVSPGFISSDSLGIETGTLTINGDFEQGAAGTLEIQIDRFGNVSHLIVNGAASLDGTVRFNLRGISSSQNYGQTFEFLAATGGRSGFFSAADYLGLGGGQIATPNITYGDNNVTLTFTTELLLGEYIDGNRTIIGNLFNSGLLAPGNSIGTIEVLGDYKQTSDGVLQTEFGANGMTDRVSVVGAASLDGTLVIDFSEAAIAQRYDYAYQFLTAGGGVTGEFATVNLANVPFNYIATPHLNYNADNVQLQFLTEVADGQMLAGNSFVVGDFINNGAVSPGSSIGTVTVLGDYSQGSGGTLAIELGAGGTSDDLDVLGGANLGGDVRFSLLGVQPLDVINRTFTFLTAVDGVTGEFDSAAFAGPATDSFLNPQLGYRPNQVQLSVDLLSFVTPDMSANQARAASALDAIVQNSPEGQMADYLQSLILTSPGLAASVINPLDNEIVANSPTAALALQSRLVRSIEGAVRKQGNSQATHLWISGMSDTSDVEDGQNRTFSFDSRDAVLGLSIAPRDDFQMGFALSVSDIELNMDSEMSSGAIDETSVAAFMNFSGLHFDVTTGASAGVIDLETERSLPSGGGTANVTGDTDGSLFGGWLSLRTQHSVAGIGVTPLARIDFTKYQSDHFAETGAGNLGLRVGSGDATSLFSQVGGDLTSQVSGIDLTLGAIWQHEFLDVVPEVSASFLADSSQGFKTKGVALSRDSTRLSLEIGVDMGPHAAFYARGGGTFSDAQSSQHIELGISAWW